jgi:hypothetical protein
MHRWSVYLYTTRFLKQKNIFFNLQIFLWKITNIIVFQNCKDFTKIVYSQTCVQRTPLLLKNSGCCCCSGDIYTVNVRSGTSKWWSLWTGKCRSEVVISSDLTVSQLSIKILMIGNIKFRKKGYLFSCTTSYLQGVVSGCEGFGILKILQ